MIAGAVAGLIYAIFAYVFGEPTVDSAIAFEDKIAAAAGEAPGEELVSRAVQSTLGLTVAALVYGIAIGGIFALVFAASYGRLGRLSPRATAAVLAVIAFLVVYAVPFLKYPANPPAVGDHDTIAKRTTLFFLMMVLGVLLAIAAVIVGKRLAPRLGAWHATVVAVGGFVLAIGLAYGFLPAVNEVPGDFPATLLWRFRLSSLALQVTMWAAFGLGFGELAERLLNPRPTTAPASTTAAPAPN
jgi:hypothetical protein